MSNNSSSSRSSRDGVGEEGVVLDRWFRLEKSGRMKDVSGQVHLSMRFSRPATKRDQHDHDDDDDDDDDDEVCITYIDVLFTEQL